MVTRQQLQEAVSYVLSCRPSEYQLWQGGYVSYGDGPPAWGVNEPVPDASYVRPRGGFCVAVLNLILRHLGLPIPNPYDNEAYDGGIVSTWEAYYSKSEWFSLSTDYPDGTLVMSPYQGEAAGSQGHIGLIWHYNGTPFVLEWIMSDGLTWEYTLQQSNNWGQYSIAIRPEQYLPLGDTPSKPEGKGYPGDLADPDVVARWMARVAYEDYDLPPVLPVMTSYVELTAAWTGPGDVKTVPGYLSARDADSYGYMQQRPSQGWGSWEQVTNADYALRKFCEVAVEQSGGSWNKGLVDADQLGQWCQAVQRSGVPNAYRDKGYPAAIKLIQGWDKGVTDPVPDDPKQEQEIWQKYGWYTFESEESWGLKYFPPVGGGTPQGPPTEEEWHKAVQEVKYRKKDDNHYEILEEDGDPYIVDETAFRTYYKPVEEQ